MGSAFGVCRHWMDGNLTLGWRIGDFLESQSSVHIYSCQCWLCCCALVSPGFPLGPQPAPVPAAPLDVQILLLCFTNLYFECAKQYNFLFTSKQCVFVSPFVFIPKLGESPYETFPCTNLYFGYANQNFFSSLSNVFL